MPEKKSFDGYKRTVLTLKIFGKQRIYNVSQKSKIFGLIVFFLQEFSFDVVCTLELFQQLLSHTFLLGGNSYAQPIFSSLMLSSGVKLMEK